MHGYKNSDAPSSLFLKGTVEEAIDGECAAISMTR
jgi:hypothetical protein